MKYILLSAILGLSLGISNVSSAASCNCDTLQTVVSLDGTTDKLVSAYRESQRGKRLCCDERSLLDAIYAFDRSTDALRCSMERGEDPCLQERIFAGVSRDFCTVEALSMRVRICGCTRELIARADVAINSIRRSGFFYSMPEYDDHERRYSEHRSPSSSRRGGQSPDPRELILRGIVGFLSNR
jgi:hypothetical protein